MLTEGGKVTGEDIRGWFPSDFTLESIGWTLGQKVIDGARSAQQAAGGIADTSGESSGDTRSGTVNIYTSGSPAELSGIVARAMRRQPESLVRGF